MQFVARASQHLHQDDVADQKLFPAEQGALAAAPVSKPHFGSARSRPNCPPLSRRLVLPHGLEIAVPANSGQAITGTPLPMQPDDPAKRLFDGRALGGLAGGRHRLLQQFVVDLDVRANGRSDVYISHRLYTRTPVDHITLLADGDFPHY